MDRIQGQQFSDLLRLLSGLSLRAYRNAWLMATPVLARFLRPEFLSGYLSATPATRLPAATVLKRMLQYARVNLGIAFAFLAQRKAFRMASAGRPFPSGPVVVLDTVVYTQAALASGSVKLVEFPGLAQELMEAGIPVVVAPSLNGPLSRAESIKLASIISDAVPAVVTIYDVVSLFDMIRLFCFALFYPFALLLFLSRLSRSGPEALVSHECLDDLPAPVVPAYLRYLYGQGIARLFPKGLTVISWWENRAGDKLFLRGLRSNSLPVTVVGSQLYVFPDNYLGAYLTEAETVHQLAPDHLLFNGPYYLPQNCLVPASVGPSLRYAEMFRHPMVPNPDGGSILVLLGYDPDGARRALATLAQVRWPAGKSIVVRLHPAHHGPLWRNLLPAQAELAEGDLYTHLAEASMVIGAETGAMLEAVACARPVINLDTLGEASLRDMPELGRDKIWLPARTAADVERQIQVARDIPVETMIEYASRYRREFFCEPQKGRLLEAFGFSNRGGKS